MATLTNRCLNEFLVKVRSSVNNKIIITRYSEVVVCNKATGYRLNLGTLIYTNQLISKTAIKTFTRNPICIKYEKPSKDLDLLSPSPPPFYKYLATSTTTNSPNKDNCLSV